jgi:hypothetical protein
VRGYALPNDGPVNEADLSTNHQATIATLTADLAAERAKVERLAAVERLRAVGDALAEALNEDMGDTTSGARITFALVEWQEARRER